MLSIAAENVECKIPIYIANSSSITVTRTTALSLHAVSLAEIPNGSTVKQLNMAS